MLNRAAKAIGAVPNMGIYADITAFRGCNMLKVDTRDHYLDIDTQMVETPRKVKTNRRNVTSVTTANLDIFVGDEGEQEALKRNAARFSLLSDEEMVEEYLK